LISIKIPVNIFFADHPAGGGDQKGGETMANIYNINDYRNKKRKQTPEEQMKRFLEEVGTWASPREQDEFYRQLAQENEADMQAMFAR